MPGWRVTPSLRVADLERSIRFYVEELGFTLLRGEATDGNVSVTFGDANLMLEAPGSFYSDGYNAAIRERLGRPGPNALYIEAEDLRGLLGRVEGAGVRVVDPLADRPWGQAEFTVEDPDGNWLTFWQRTPGA
jgi:catechol 2,3-dioxygenase-like lactoylglutathione lyase family enzyme